jgi:hypothetical protein
VGNGALPHQNTSGIYVQNTENQKIGLLDGFHFNQVRLFKWKTEDAYDVEVTEDLLSDRLDKEVHALNVGAA